MVRWLAWCARPSQRGNGTGIKLCRLGFDVSAATAIFLVLLAGALVNSLLSIVAAWRYLSVPSSGLASSEPVSILKPLSGLDLGLESNLRTFFEQDYPAFEILFAVRESDDPAGAVVRKLQQEYP